jgi:hypothetical protein
MKVGDHAASKWDYDPIMRLMRVFSTGAVAVLLSTAVAVVAAPGVALADPLEPGHWYTIRNVATNKYLGVNNGQDQNGAKVIQYDELRQSNWQPIPDQSWLLVDQKDGWWSFRNAGTNPWKALVIEGAGTANGDGAVQYTYNPDSQDQRWSIYSQGDSWKLRSHKSDKCLAIAGGVSDNGKQAIQYTCNGLYDQMWDLEMFL